MEHKRRTVWPSDSNIGQIFGEKLPNHNARTENKPSRNASTSTQMGGSHIGHDNVLSPRIPVAPRHNVASSPINKPSITRICLAPTSQDLVLSPRMPVAGKPWKFYHGFLGIELGGPATLAHRKNSDRQIVAIKSLKGEIGKIQALVENTHKNIIQCHDIYFVPGSFFLIEECMDVTLSEVVACPWDLEEEQIAAVCSEVCF